MNWYYTFLIRRPYLMVLSIGVLCSACIIVSLTITKIPDFSDPSLGFEARGTNIGNRLIAWKNLLEENGPSGSLASNPNDLLIFQSTNNNDIRRYKQKLRKNRKRKKDHKKKNQAKLTKNRELKKSDSFLKNQTSVHNDDDDNINNFLSTYSPPSESYGDSGIFRAFEITNDTMATNGKFTNKSIFEYGRNMSFADDNVDEKLQTKKKTWQILKQANPSPSWNDNIYASTEVFFCDSPAKEFSHFVVERIGPNATDSLFDLNGLLSMCQLEELITSAKSYDEFCQKEDNEINCCRPWSLPNYVALLTNKTSCFDLNKDDLKTVTDLLRVCYEYFTDLRLNNDCNKNMHCLAPPECTQHNAVFDILHYLTDFNFIKSNDSRIYLKYAMIFVPVIHSTQILPLFYEWKESELKTELVEVVAMDLGQSMEDELFNDYLLTDSWLLSLGGLFVMSSMLIYTASVFVTVMSSIAVMFSVGLAYFVYTFIFEMSFFPYMNLLVIVIMIGIGADNAFLLIKIWECVLADRFLNKSLAGTESVDTLQNLMATTLRHAAVSMLISSLTTAAAFYASYSSSISSIKCFGVFAGTAVVANYFLMITWLPATISIMERFTSCTVCGKLNVSKLLSKLSQSINKLCIYLENLIINLVVRHSLKWIFLFTVIGAFSAAIVTYWPGLQLPENSHFQLFVDYHPFEVYHSKLKNEFWFEKSMISYENFKLPLRFVWGIQPVDDGDYTNPYSNGILHYDNNFNISSETAQVWLLNFCRQLREQPFYQLTLGLLLPNCFIENFISFMNRVCIDSMDGTDRTPCCDISKFPYQPNVFDLCLPQSITSLYATPREFFLPGVAGPKFASPEHTAQRALDRQSFTNVTSMATPVVKALVIEFESNVSFSTSYHEINQFVKTVESWFSNQLQSAPTEMRGGWFTSELKFFDVQDTLSKGTVVAILIAMGVSLSVLLLVTLNLLISIYAVLTVFLTIFTTVAVLILFGWKLNVLESIAVSTAIGLAVDYSLHYSVHYNMSPTQERMAATRHALARIIGPTAMAAFTTGIAGAIMLFSNVLPYIQIGIFLVVVTSLSWLYATFFLMSLLKMFGPEHGFMQFSFSKLIKNKRPARNATKFYDDKETQAIASEQLLTLSSSAIGELITSESHELDSLTPNSQIRTISGFECSNTSPLELLYPYDKNRDIQKNIPISCKEKYYKSPTSSSAVTVDLPADDT